MTSEFTEFSGFLVPGMEHLPPDEAEEAVAVTWEIGEMYDDAFAINSITRAIYASKLDLESYNEVIASIKISGRHLSRLFNQLRRIVMEYRRNKERGYDQGAWSITKARMQKVESFQGLPELFDTGGELINVEFLRQCLEAGIASGNRRFTGVSTQSDQFLKSYVDWRLQQEAIVASEA